MFIVTKIVVRSCFLSLIIILISCNFEEKPKDNSLLCEQLEQMTEDDKRYRSIIVNTENQNTIDSLWQMQLSIDIQNTKKLIEIVQSNGWPNKKNLKCQNMGAPLVIFRHTPNEFTEEVKELMENEYKEGRIDYLNYKFIDNHLNGRPTDFLIE